MIKSMTGFGHGEMSNAANQKVTIEMKAVNHRSVSYTHLTLPTICSV